MNPIHYSGEISLPRQLKKKKEKRYISDIRHAYLLRFFQSNVHLPTSRPQEYYFLRVDKLKRAQSDRRGYYRTTD